MSTNTPDSPEMPGNATAQPAESFSSARTDHEPTNTERPTVSNATDPENSSLELVETTVESSQNWTESEDTTVITDSSIAESTGSTQLSVDPTDVSNNDTGTITTRFDVTDDEITEVETLSVTSQGQTASVSVAEVSTPTPTSQGSTSESIADVSTSWSVTSQDKTASVSVAEVSTPSSTSQGSTSTSGSIADSTSDGTELVSTDSMTSETLTSDVTTDHVSTVASTVTSEKEWLTTSQGQASESPHSTRDYTSSDDVSTTSGDVSTVGVGGGGGGTSNTLAIAIGVSVGVVVIVVIVALVVCVLRRRRDRKHHSNEDNVKDYEVDYKTHNRQPKTTKRKISLAKLTIKKDGGAVSKDDSNSPDHADHDIKPATKQNYFQEGLDENGLSNPSYACRDELWTVGAEQASSPEEGPWTRLSDGAPPNDQNDNPPEAKRRNRPFPLKNVQDRYSMGPIMLDDLAPSSQKTYDKMYSTHNTFK